MRLNKTRASARYHRACGCTVAFGGGDDVAGHRALGDGRGLRVAHSAANSGFGGTGAFQFQTTNPVGPRHGILVSNCDVATVTGSAAFVRIGKQPGVAYSTEMEP